MKYSIKWSFTAKSRLMEILDYVSRDDPDAALTLIDKLLDRVGALDEIPEAGSWYLRSREGGLRQVIQTPYRIVYQVVDANKEIYVLASLIISFLIL